MVLPTRIRNALARPFNRTHVRAATPLRVFARLAAQRAMGIDPVNYGPFSVGPGEDPETSPAGPYETWPAIGALAGFGYLAPPFSLSFDDRFVDLFSRHGWKFCVLRHGPGPDQESILTQVFQLFPPGCVMLPTGQVQLSYSATRIIENAHTRFKLFLDPEFARIAGKWMQDQQLAVPILANVQFDIERPRREIVESSAPDPLLSRGQLLELNGRQIPVFSKNVIGFGGDRGSGRRSGLFLNGRNRGKRRGRRHQENTD